MSSQVFSMSNWPASQFISDDLTLLAIKLLRFSLGLGHFFQERIFQIKVAEERQAFGK